MALDDNSPAPMMPTLELPEEVEVTQKLAQDDAKLAQSYFSPAWEKVQDRFEAAIAECKDSSGVSENLPASEFKAQILANSKVAIFLTGLMEDIKNAVTAVEAAQKPEKTTGGK